MVATQPSLYFPQALKALLARKGHAAKQMLHALKTWTNLLPQLSLESLAHLLPAIRDYPRVYLL